jgi:hypothetical protein
MFACDCGQSLLIAGYEPRHFLGIAIKCAACGRISQTPGLPEGAMPPPSVTVVDRGETNPPTRLTADMVLISREETQRLAALYRPRATDTDSHALTDALLDDIDNQQWRFTGAFLDPAPANYKSAPLAWAVAHLRERLRHSDWKTFSGDHDMVAMTMLAAFRDLFASWAHHPLFTAMVNSVASDRFSLHALAIFGVAKSLMLSGNQVIFMPGPGPRPEISGLRLAEGPNDSKSVVVNRFDRFEWPDHGQATAQSVRAAVEQAMASVRGGINRLHPGILVLSGGASDAALDRLMFDGAVAAMGTEGKRNRGLAAVAAIFPKIGLTGKPREARFGYAFYPVPNRNHAIGQSVRIGSRADHAGFG